MRKKLSRGDREFLVKKAMPFFRVGMIQVDWSDSRKHWPDIWCERRNGAPIITVTQEWARQNAEERRKRLVHEFVHLSWDKDHGKIKGLRFSTYPSQDEYSKAVYERIK